MHTYVAAAVIGAEAFFAFDSRRSSVTPVFLEACDRTSLTIDGSLVAAGEEQASLPKERLILFHRRAFSLGGDTNSSSLDRVPCPMFHVPLRSNIIH